MFFHIDVSFDLQPGCMLVSRELFCVQTSSAQPAPTVSASQPTPTATATATVAAAATVADTSRPPAANPPVCCLLNLQSVND